MPNYIRPRVPGASIFFTVNLANRGSDLLITRIDDLRHAVALTKADHPFHIDAWVVLPDHLHAIWTLPEQDCDFSTRWKKIKARFSQSVGHAAHRSSSLIAKGEAGIWQRRFWDHHLRDSAAFTNALQYCWNNPVKHGLVTQPEDWPYTSIHRATQSG